MVMQRRVAEWPELVIRAEETPAGRMVSGLAAPYWETITVDGLRERIAPGSFSAVLGGERDVLALLDHDSLALLGRVSAGTLRLVDRVDGLGFELLLPDTTLGRDVFEQVGRGDLGGVSIGFKVTGSRSDTSAGLRTWRMIDLYELSLITPFPAYRKTRVELGALGSEREAVRHWLEVRQW